MTDNLFWFVSATLFTTVFLLVAFFVPTKDERNANFIAACNSGEFIVVKDKDRQRVWTCVATEVVNTPKEIAK